MWKPEFAALVVNLDKASAGALCTLILLASGCEKSPIGQTAPDAAVSAKAATWPSYRAPRVVDPAPPGRPPRLAPVAERYDPKPVPAWVVVPRDQWNIEQTAEDSLGRIGESAVPSLVKSLNHPKEAFRLRAATILGRIGPDARKAVPQLVAALQDSELTVRKAAAWALGQIGPDASDAVVPLLQVLEESTPSQLDVAPASAQIN